MDIGARRNTCERKAEVSILFALSLRFIFVGFGHEVGLVLKPYNYKED